MSRSLPAIPFSSFLYVTIIGHLIFAIPAVGGVLLFNLMNVKVLLLIFFPIAIISIPISASFAWLIAKGSNWANTSVAITAVCGLPGRIYAVIFGGLLGFRFFNTTGAILLAILFYLLVYVLTFPLGKFLSKKVIPDAVSQKG